MLLTSSRRRGAEIEGHQLADHLRSCGLDTTVAALQSTEDDVRLNVTVLGKTALGTRTLRRLRRMARDSDVVIAYGSSTLPACAIALTGCQTPFVYRSIGDPAAWMRGGWHRLRTRMLLSRAAHVVPIWPGAAETFHDVYRVPRSLTTTIPNTRSAVDFAPPTDDQRIAARQRFGLPPERFVIAVIGSLSTEKRVDLVLDATARLRNVHLLIAGTGPEQEVLQRSARENGTTVDDVSFLGALDDVRPVLYAADCLVLTSGTEGMPGVMLEAGLVGVPVLATDVGAVSWMFRTGRVRGRTVSASVTAAELGDAIETMRAAARSGDQVPSPQLVEFASTQSSWIDVIRAVVEQAS